MTKPLGPNLGATWKKPKSPQVPGGQRKHTCRQNPRQLEPGSPPPPHSQNKVRLNRPVKGILGLRLERERVGFLEGAKRVRQ